MAGSTIAVPVAELLTRLRDGANILGLCFTPDCTRLAVIGPNYNKARTIQTEHKWITAEDLSRIADQEKVSALVLGGTALYRADGGTHFGVRKVIAPIIGMSYEKSELVPARRPNHIYRPVWLCREGIDDPQVLLVNYIMKYTYHVLLGPNAKAPTPAPGQSQGQGPVSSP